MGDVCESRGAGECFFESFVAKVVVGFVGDGDGGVGDHRGKDVIEFVSEYGGHHAEGGELALVCEVALELVDARLEELEGLLER